MAAKDMKRYPPTGINVAIIGGGVGGLTAAIECHRKGHNVRVFERRGWFEPFGDLLGIGRSGQRSMIHWPGFLNRLYNGAMPSRLTYYKYDGTKIATLSDRKTVDGLSGMPLWRSKLHAELYKYVEELGIEFMFDKKATVYFETEDTGCVVFEDGDAIMADLVIAADGIASKSTELIVAHPEKPTNSGYAIYRVSFPLDIALKDPTVKEFWGDPDEGVRIFLAENLHIVTAKSTKENRICWMMTHRETEGSASEVWSNDCPASNALKFVPEEDGWAKYIPALIKITPDNACVNWNLVWRSPQERWSSPQHRILQLGDACHPFIPTSGSGAVMAMEDGYSIAECLRLAGKKEKVPIAVQVHNKLRFERVSFAQRMGFETREVYHHPNWKTFTQNPRALAVGAAWVYDHDAEKYTHENYDQCAYHILHGARFENTNIPPGKKYEQWTVQGLVEEANRNDAKTKL